MNQPVKIQQYFLTTNNGFSVTVLNYGASLQSIKIPQGRSQVEVMVGYLRPDEYVADTSCMGAIAGRFCNRIAHGKYQRNGHTHQLTLNDGEHHLHGGEQGFNKRMWQVVERINGQSPGIKLAYFSADGEEGYPGNVNATAIYQILDDNKLLIDIEATSDKETPINLTGHGYFNLNRNNDSIENHHLQVRASHYLPIDDSCIPTGEIEPVGGSDFDFLQPVAVGQRLHSSDPQIARQSGLDHNFVLDDADGDSQLAATVFSPQTQITLNLYTNQPGLQVYTGNHLSGQFKPYQGICLEPQFFPDSPNHPQFPDCFLRPGQKYRHRIIYEFLW